jgi:hypothetical protein
MWLVTTMKYLFFATIGLSLVACDRIENMGKPMNATVGEISDAQWEALAKRKVFFGHQSVGYNILDGVKDLAASNPKVALRIAAVSGKQDFVQPVLGHAEVGENTNPKSKIDGFAKLLDSGIGNQADVALMKFCYVDVEDSTDMAKLFDEYKTTIAHLKSEYPKTTFVHVTMPLVAKRQDIKTLAKNAVKRILGRPVWNISLNAKRGDFNDMLVREYAGRDFVFDLAKIESTAPNGQRITDSVDGLKFYSLFPDFTDDGGHLNNVGRKIVAAEFVRFLASVPESPTEK